MFKIVKTSFLTLLISGLAFGASADRGVGKKSKSKVLLNVNTSGGFKPNLALNLSSGLTYTGSLLSSPNSNNFNSTSIVTYQKGNNTYILPYKQRVLVPEVRQGYTGMKLIIKTH